MLVFQFAIAATCIVSEFVSAQLDSWEPKGVCLLNSLKTLALPRKWSVDTLLFKTGSPTVQKIE